MIDLHRFRRDHRIKQRELQELLDVSQSYISQLESFEKPLTKIHLDKLLDHYGETINSYHIEQSDIKIEHEKTGVPYYDLDTFASIRGSFNDIKEFAEYYIDFKPFNDCIAYFPVYGNSMHPEFSSGEIVAVKKLYNTEVILWGETYLVITNEEGNNLRTLKMVYQHKSNDKFILRSANPEYSGDTVIKKSSVLGMYLVKGKITRKHF